MLIKDGSIRRTLITSAARYNDEGNPIGFQGTIRYITKHRLFEEKLKEENKTRKEIELLYKATIDNSHTGISTIQDGKFQFLNYYCAAILGYKVDGLIRVYTKSMVYPDDLQSTKTKSLEILQGISKIPYEFRVITKYVAIVWATKVLTTIRYKGKPDILSNINDITDFRLTIQDVEKLKSTEVSILQTIPIALIGLENRYINFANDAVQNVFGWKPMYVIGKSSSVLYRYHEEYQNWVQSLTLNWRRKRYGHPSIFAVTRTVATLLALLTPSLSATS
jgi:PAS domain S-box-containing protein